MRIYIRTDKGRIFKIPLPLLFVKGALATGNLALLIGKRYIPMEKRIYIDSVDFRELIKSLDVLKEYKGLTLVKVNSNDGTEVIVTV